MYQVIIVVHVLLGLGVIALVLLQQGKGADAGAAFGSASSGSVFGAQGASSFLSRATAILATLFFSTSLGLAVLSGHQQDGPIDIMDAPEVEEVFTDLPSINSDESEPVKAIPLNKEELPSDIVIPKETSNDTVDKLSEKTKIISDDAQSISKKVVKDTQNSVSDKLDEAVINK